MTEKILAIEYLLEKLDGRLECHCDIFRKISGMKSSTAERRLREWRGIYKKDFFWAFGYKSISHTWRFQKSFITFLKREMVAAKAGK